MHHRSFDPYTFEFLMHARTFRILSVSLSFPWSTRIGDVVEGLDLRSKHNQLVSAKA